LRPSRRFLPLTRLDLFFFTLASSPSDQRPSSSASKESSSSRSGKESSSPSSSPRESSPKLESTPTRNTCLSLWVRRLSPLCRLCFRVSLAEIHLLLCPGDLLICFEMPLFAIAHAYAFCRLDDYGPFLASSRIRSSRCLSSSASSELPFLFHHSRPFPPIRRSHALPPRSQRRSWTPRRLLRLQSYRPGTRHELSIVRTCRRSRSLFGTCEREEDQSWVEIRGRRERK